MVGASKVSFGNTCGELSRADIVGGKAMANNSLLGSGSTATSIERRHLSSKKRRTAAALLLCASLVPLTACSSTASDSAASAMARDKTKVAPGQSKGGSTTGGTTTTTTTAPVSTPTPTSAAVYDASIGTAVDADGFATLPLRSGAHRYFVSSVGSDRNGCSNAQQPATPLRTITAAMSCVQNASGDQVLLAEGSTFNEVMPWLAFKGGFSAAYPTVISSYDPNDPANTDKYGRGDQRGARPILTGNPATDVNQGLVSGGTFAYIAIKGLDFNPGNVSGAGLVFRGFGSYLLFENNIFRYTGLSYDSGDYPASPTAQHVIVRNNSFYGMWSTGGRTGGFYVSGVNGPTVEDNVFYHCGWKIGANRDDDPSIGGATVFSHSYYIQTNTTNAIVRRNLSADGAGDGGIARGDSVFTENLFIDNPAAIGLGGGPQYNVDRPNGVSFDASYNAILGDADVTSTHQLGWAINTTNGQSGSRVHHNLIIRSRNPLGPEMSGFSNNAAFNQPSYAQYDHNVMYQWVAVTGQVYWPACGSFLAQCHTTYDSNNWDGPAQGTNTNSGSTPFPNPYTAAQLYVALGFADKTAFMNYALNHPEAHIQRTARARLFAGYGM